MGDGGAEERHDSVAHDLVDRALVEVNGLHHLLDDGIEQPARVFRIAGGDQLGRPLEVGEEDGDVLPLVLEGVARLQDAIGEVAWRVHVRRREALGWGGGHARPAAHGMGAFWTELCGWRERTGALRTAGGERGAALLAKLRPRATCSAAARAFHAMSLSAPYLPQVEGRPRC